MCNCTDDYNHFLVKCQYNIDFWKLFSNYIKTIKDPNFDMSLDEIVLGGNIRDSSFSCINILIELSSYAVCKSRLIYYKTNNAKPISILFMWDKKIRWDCK